MMSILIFNRLAATTYSFMKQNTLAPKKTFKARDPSTQMRGYNIFPHP